MIILIQEVIVIKINEESDDNENNKENNDNNIGINLESNCNFIRLIVILLL